jgi:hypothetical protein
MYDSWCIEFQHYGAQRSVAETAETTRRNINLNKSEAAVAPAHVKIRVRIRHSVLFTFWFFIIRGVTNYQGVTTNSTVSWTPVSYSRGPGYKFLSEGWLTWQIFYGSSQSLLANARAFGLPQIGHDFPHFSNSFSAHRSIISYYLIWTLNMA